MAAEPGRMPHRWSSPVSTFWTLQAGVAVGAALVAGSTALLGFGLDSGIEALASIIVIWRFTGRRLHGSRSERCAQQLVALSFFLLAPYIAVEAIRGLASVDRPEISIVGIVLTAGPAVLQPPLGLAKRRIGARLGSIATAGEGTQNLLCSYLAIAVLVGLLANTLLGVWWLDGVVALAISGWALVEGRRAWHEQVCTCVASPMRSACETDSRAPWDQSFDGNTALASTPTVSRQTLGNALSTRPYDYSTTRK